MIVKITTFLLFSYCVQSTGHNSNDIGVSKILQCYAMLAQFEDLDYCVQLTGHNKQKTGHNSGGISAMSMLIVNVLSANSIKKLKRSFICITR